MSPKGTRRPWAPSRRTFGSSATCPKAGCFDTAMWWSPREGRQPSSGRQRGHPPALCPPQAADQFLNAEASARSGIGLALCPDQAAGTAVTEAVQRLLTEAGIRGSRRSRGGQLAEMPLPEEAIAVVGDPVRLTSEQPLSDCPETHGPSSYRGAPTCR